MSGHPGHKDPTPNFFAPINHPSSDTPQANPAQQQNTVQQTGNNGAQPASGIPAANPAQQQQTTPSTGSGPTAWYRSFFQQAATNKAFALFLAMNVISFAMGGYILLAPSRETVSTNARAFVPVISPSPYPITEPTTEPSPTEILEPTQEPEEIIEEPTIAPTETPIPTPTTDPTNNWNTYTNVDYGYTIKYPLNWTALNLGVLEPKVPSYVVFNQNTATTSARSITVSVSSRTYREQLDINGTLESPYRVAGIQGTWQDLRDSDGNTSIAITLPRTDSILILRSKAAFASTLYQMLPTLYVSD